MIAAGEQVVRGARDPGFTAIAAHIAERTGIGGGAARDGFLAQRVDARVRALGLSGYGPYLERLTSCAHRTEWDALVDEITVGETFFFRYAAQWDAVRDVILPERRARRLGAPLRIWCAGCANGAEPYSLAILLRQAAPFEGEGATILATDICTSRLKEAERALYGEWELRALSEEQRTDWFVREGKQWRLREKFRRGVEFRTHNLAADSEAIWDRVADFDIIFCRNVMIYFDPELIRRLLGRFHQLLDDGGWFLTGHSEPYLEISNVFSPAAAAGTMLYRKQGAIGARAGAAPPDLSAVRPPPAVAGVRRARPASPRPVLTAVGEDIEEARRLANRGEWAKASALCQRLADREPLSADVHFLLALTALHKGAAGPAEAALRRALYIDPDFALAHYHLGMAAASRGAFAEAARSLRNVFRSLQEAEETAPVRGGDGVTAADLRQYARLQLGEIGE